ncbi:hypothetical protein MUG91_G165n45 [Manis pentadactyla]|nr:hypothetical protein MUG91_G165n45 [Manis pentadactyla]
MPIAQLLELWKKIEVEPMETETTEEDLNLDSEPTIEDTVEEGKCDSALPETTLEASAEVECQPKAVGCPWEIRHSSVALRRKSDFSLFQELR